MSNIDKRGLLNENPFSYRVTKSGKVFIHWHGKHVTTLVGKKAQKFTAQIAHLSEHDAQLLMARLTGNFKRGNERP